MDFPVDFTEKAKLPASAGGSGYPYKISANDLMRNFHHAALDAEDGWIESNNNSLYNGRKLKLPKLPSGAGLFLLGCSGGSLKWIEDTGGGASGTFLASLVDGNISVTSGSYHILNSSTSVSAMAGSGQFVYAVIEHSNAGIFKEFKIEISQTSKDPTNLDPTERFVQFSNILLAEGMVVGGKPVMVQRRVGNLSLVHQVVSGHICLWAYSTGGTAL